MIEAGECRLVNRRRIDMTDRFPELAQALARLPSGTMLDGEVVVLRPEDGKPDFAELQSRDQTRSAERARWAAQRNPATYVAFDQLYRAGESIMPLPLHDRRTILTQTLKSLGHEPRVILSQGIVGGGKAYFQQACVECLEGVVAKRLSSPYQPGKRTNAWVKIKRQEVVHCLVIGFVPEGTSDFGALIIAAEVAGGVRCVGKVGTGFDARRRKRINEYLWSHLRDRPVVPAGKYAGRWVEPGLYCAVRCMERTAAGQLRAPAVVEIYDR
jgi:ATP-dependent DNA ligase